MPLSAVVESYTNAIREFLRTESPGPLYLRVAPESELLAIKLIATLQAHAASDELFFGHSGPFNDAATYYAQAAQGVIANLAEHAAALSEHGPPLLGLAALRELEPDRRELNAELAFAEFAERLGRELSGVCQRVVFVLHVEQGTEFFLPSTQNVAAATALGRIKYIVLTAADAQLSTELQAPQRFNVVKVHGSLHDATQGLRAFVACPLRRVLLVQRPHRQAESARASATVARLCASLAPAELVWLEPQLDPQRPLTEAVISALAAELRRRGQPLDTRNDLPAAAQFADACERLARLANARLATRAVFCVAITVCAASARASDELAAFVLDLVRAAAAPRVCYIVFDGSTSACLPALVETPRRVHACSVRIDANVIEAGLRERLADPSLPVHERTQFLGACATLAVRRDEHEAALMLHEQQLTLCERAAEPSDALPVWLGIGDTFAAMQRWADAEAAYSNALALGLEHERGVFVAHALSRLGQTCLHMENPAEAITYYQAAVNWHEQCQDALWNLHARTWLGEAQRRSGDSHAARSTWLAARERCGLSDASLGEATAQARAELTERLARLAEQHDDIHAAAQERQHLRDLGCEKAFVAEQP